MKTEFGSYVIEVIDDPDFTLGSMDNISNYDKIYFDEIEYRPTSKHGIKVTKDGQSVSSALVCEAGGRTGVYEHSFIIKGEDVFICCCNMVYSFKLPDLTLNWKKQFDMAACFQIYAFREDLIIHGELTISRIDVDGNLKWDFSARDIFVTPDGTESLVLHEDSIELTDWQGYRYKLNADGTEIISKYL